MKLILSVLILNTAFYAQAEPLELEQVLQKVIDHYPSIQSATLQVEKAKQENVKAESQLSWQLNSNAGFARDTSLFGSTSDRYSLAANLNRSLSHGGVLGFNANVSRDDAENTFSPALPNPSTKARVDVNYRHHLQKGAENPQYSASKNAALAGINIAKSEKSALYDELATQVIDVYLAAAMTQARIKNTQQTIDRGLRLKKYISKEFKLGLSEEKDVLQIDAQLATNRAEQKSLQTLWKKQNISLNRLMNQPWSNEFTPRIKLENNMSHDFEIIYAAAQSQSPALKKIEARLVLANSEIELSRDKRQDELDLVMFLGNELNKGDTASGNYNESEMIAGISLEFKRGLDKSGLNAELKQAHYAKDLALQDKKIVLQNLQYSVASLLVEFESAEQAVIAFSKSVKAEHKKLNEAENRYKDGRIETDRIIDFEKQLANAELSYELQKIELARRYHQLDLLSGNLWETVHRAEINFDFSSGDRALNNQYIDKGIN